MQSMRALFSGTSRAVFAAACILSFACGPSTAELRGSSEPRGQGLTSASSPAPDAGADDAGTGDAGTADGGDRSDAGGAATASADPGPLPDLKRACDSGDAASCRLLGDKLYRGDGVAKDEARAVPALRAACDARIVESCEQLADAYWNGRGVEKDAARAVKLLEPICNDAKPPMRVCIALSEMLSSPAAGSAHDEHQSVRLLERACYENEPEACRQAGMIFLEGLRGIPYNQGTLRQGVVYLQKACGLGSMGACLTLADLHDVGRGVPKNPAKAYALRKKACDGGVEGACERLSSRGKTKGAAKKP
jgi:TPR repeat protein